MNSTYSKFKFVDSQGLYFEKELLLESLIKAYGFEDVVVIMSLTSENVNVITKCAEITADDSIKIYSIIEEENLGNPLNVKIIPIV